MKAFLPISVRSTFYSRPPTLHLHTGVGAQKARTPFHFMLMGVFTHWYLTFGHLSAEGQLGHLHLHLSMLPLGP